jgi:GNAT superfamily N-acetyltransferase
LGYSDVQPSGLIDHFFVLPTAQGQGVGRALMQHNLARARAMGLGQVHSDVSCNAQGFYAQFGFLPQSLNRIETPNAEDCFNATMRLELARERGARHAPSEAVHWSTEGVAASDFEAVLALRLVCMRESLERLGRFSPERARERLVASFAPEHGRHVVVGGERVGYITVRPLADSLRLEHLYIHPKAQSTGLGSAVLRRLIEQADAARQPMEVGVLAHSNALAFYLRHGFVGAAFDGLDWTLHRAISGFDYS